MNRILAASLFGLSLATSSLAYAEPVKIGVITTLSGGGAGLGIDMRDAFTLAIKQSGNKDVELVIEDDAQKPELAVQIAEKMIQGDKVDLMTGITYTWMDTDLDLHRNPLLPIPPQERHLQISDHFVAPILATRFTNDFTERIRHETLLGLGGFGAGEAPNLTWQATSVLSYRFSDHWWIGAGYRALGLRDDDFHVTFHGPLIGIGLRF